jgi:hypothetical protein
MWTFESPILQRMSPHFAPEGLRYVRSRPRLERARGDLTPTMAMWSSHSNMPGESVALEVISTVYSAKLAKWIRQTGVGRNNAVWTVDTKHPETGRFQRNHNVWGLTPATFVELAEKIRTWSWTPMAALETDEPPDPLPPRLEPVADNYACWLWMRGEHERALAIPYLDEAFVAKLKQLPR